MQSILIKPTYIYTQIYIGILNMEYKYFKEINLFISIRDDLIYYHEINRDDPSLFTRSCDYYYLLIFMKIYYSRACGISSRKQNETRSFIKARQFIRTSVLESRILASINCKAKLMCESAASHHAFASLYQCPSAFRA